MPVGELGRHSAPGGALDEPLLNQIRLVDLLKSSPVLPDSRCERVEAHRPAGELDDQAVQDLPIPGLEARIINTKLIKRVLSALPADGLLARNIGVITYPAQQSLGYAHRSAGASPDLKGGFLLQAEAEQFRVAGHTLGKLLHAVVLQMLDDAETAAHGSCNETGSGGRADQGEAGQVKPDGTRGGTLAQDDVYLEVLHGRVEVFFSNASQAVDFIDEKDVAVFECVGENGRQVAGFL